MARRTHPRLTATHEKTPPVAGGVFDDECGAGQAPAGTAARRIGRFGRLDRRRMPTRLTGSPGAHVFDTRVSLTA